MSKGANILKSDWKPKSKKNASAVMLSDTLNTIANMLNNFAVIYGGRCEVTKDGIKVFCFGSGGVAFSGVAYNSAGVAHDVNTDSTKPWVVYDANGDTFSEEIGPAPSPWPPHQVWYRKAGTAGDIVVKRLG